MHLVKMAQEQNTTTSKKEQGELKKIQSTFYIKKDNLV